jgi:hypothetical protein
VPSVSSTSSGHHHPLFLKHLPCNRCDLCRATTGSFYHCDLCDYDECEDCHSGGGGGGSHQRRASDGMRLVGYQSPECTPGVFGGGIGSGFQEPYIANFGGQPVIVGSRGIYPAFPPMFQDPRW